jgi:anti-sigma factor RsiW
MKCSDLEDHIEALAAGDEPDGAFAAHVDECQQCAAALSRARWIEQTLAARPVPVAPARFAPAVAARIRLDAWRSEQQVDRVFNVAVAAGLIAIVGGTLALVNLSTVTDAIVAGASALNGVLTQREGAVEIQVPALSTYLLIGGFLVTAVLVWSWAERSGRSS